MQRIEPRERSHIVEDDEATSPQSSGTHDEMERGALNYGSTNDESRPLIEPSNLGDGGRHWR